MSGRPAQSLQSICALLLVCLLWSLDALCADLLPTGRSQALPEFERQAIAYALPALVAAAYVAVRRIRWPGSRVAWAAAGSGLALFVAPAMLATAAHGWISQLERVAIFSLTPVFAVVLEPHFAGITQQNRSALAAALIAVAGALCLFPLDAPGSVIATAALFAVILAAICAAAANCIAVRLATARPEFSMAAFAAIASAAAACAFAAASLATEHAERRTPPVSIDIPWLAAVDLPALLLLFWLMRRMTAARMTTRFVLAPWTTVLAGIALERPAVTVRMALGLALMGAGAGWLLLARDDDADRAQLGIL